MRQQISSLTHRLQTPREECEHLLNTDCIRPSSLIEVRDGFKYILQRIWGYEGI